MSPSVVSLGVVPPRGVSLELVSLIEHTQLHEIREVVARHGRGERLLGIHVLNVLQLAERIMFSQRLELSEFEPDTILVPSKETIELLQRSGCLAGSGDEGGPRLTIVPFSERQYGEVCVRAAGEILPMLERLTSEVVQDLCPLVDNGVMPKGFVEKEKNVFKSRMAREFFAKDPPLPEFIEEKRRTSLAGKTIGAFNFIIASSGGILERLRALLPDPEDPDFAKKQIALEIFFRVAINEGLADLRQAVYSPMPNRARAVLAADLQTRRTFREAVEARMFLGVIRREVGIPLPMFAMCFLGRELRVRGLAALIDKMQVEGPLRLLEAARKLHDHGDIAEIREWLSRYERLYASRDTEEQRRAFDELNRIAAEYLGPRESDKDFFSVFRGDLTRQPGEPSNVGVESPRGRLSGQEPLSHEARLGALLSWISTELLCDRGLWQHLFQVQDASQGLGGQFPEDW